MSKQIDSIEAMEIFKKRFEECRRIDADGDEFWSARDLMILFDYAGWRTFRSVVLKTQIAVETSGDDPDDHFSEAVASIPGAARNVTDWHLSRHACYMLVQSASPLKKMVAQGKKYIAFQTYRAQQYERNTNQFAFEMFVSTQIDDIAHKSSVTDPTEVQQMRDEAATRVRLIIKPDSQPPLIGEK